MGNTDLISKVLSLRGEMSFGLIAKKLGVSRNVVAGICFRVDWPHSSRVRSPNARSGNKSGTGRRPPRQYANRTLPHPRGETHIQSILKNKDVKAIRAAPRKMGLIGELAEKFGVSYWTIRDIRYGRNWRHVPLKGAQTPPLRVEDSK